MKENERLLCKFFDAPEESRVIFVTGSGTASMEGGIINFFTKKDKLIVVNGGSFGHRFAEICSIHEIPFKEIKLNYGEPLTEDRLREFESSGYTGMVLQHCETSTGIKYDLDLVGDFCYRNGIFLFVDAISSFMSDPLSMKKMHINAAITGSQKALALPPSMSFTVLDTEAVRRCNNNEVNSLYFRYKDYLKDGERGQTPYTPAVSTLLQLNEKLRRIELTGGIIKQNELAKSRAEYFREKIADLPLKIFTDKDSTSNCVTALCPSNPNVNAHKIFEIIKDEYQIWICPNGGDLSEKVFRVGHIGAIKKEEIDKLIEVFNDLVKRNLL